MKKQTIILTFLILLCTGSLIQAQGFSMSAGGGLTLGNTFYTAKALNSDGVNFKRNEFGVGAFGFFDATYAELNIGYKFEFLKGSLDLNDGLETEGSRRSLNIGILGKFPFGVGSFDLYPLVGLQYTIVNYFEDISVVYSNLSSRNALWIMAGGGGDFHLSDALFLRGQLLWGFRMDTEQEKSNKNFDYFSHGPNIKIAIGYQFFQGSDRLGGGRTSGAAGNAYSSGGSSLTQAPESDFTVSLGADNKSAVITGYNGRGGSIIIPDTIQGMPVIQIAERAFRETRVTEVVIPEGVTAIGANAFIGCSRLTRVTLPSTIRSIGAGAFNGCGGLAEVNIPAGTRIEWNGNTFVGSAMQLASQALLRGLGYTGGF